MSTVAREYAEALFLLCQPLILFHLLQQQFQQLYAA